MTLDEIFDFVKWVTPFVVGWNVWLHNKVTLLEKNVAVNTAKDNEVWKRIDTIDTDLKEIKNIVIGIKQEFAYLKGKSGS